MSEMGTIYKRVNLHHATDRRCYNGACCSDLQKEVDSRSEAKSYLKSLGLNVTYFPAGEFYIGFQIVEGVAPRILTGDCRSFEEAANAAITQIEKENTWH